MRIRALFDRMAGLPPLVLLTDFGVSDAYVGVMKGVIASVEPALRVIDLTHGIPPQDVERGAEVLAESWRWFPAGSVFVAVVDPGVGTARRALVARVGERYFLGPDNGLITRIAAQDAVRDVRSMPDTWGLPARSATFHGRDLFAPAAARLAAGLVAFDDAVATGFIALPERPPGTVRAIDAFGNAITDLPGRPDGLVVWTPADDRVPVRVSVVGTYADGKAGALVALTGSGGSLELAVPGGSAGIAAGVRVGDRVRWEPA